MFADQVNVNSPRLHLRALLGLGLGLGFASSSTVSAQVTTWRNDIARTGQNQHELVLTPQNVNQWTFGKIASYPVDGYVYGQPLYLPGLQVNGSARNVVFVATEHDSVFAFDTDKNTLLWKASMLDAQHGAAAGATPVSAPDIANHDVGPELGITATPVIDPATNTIYVEAISKENGGFVHRLHALDVTTGAERTNSPVSIAPTVPGTGAGSVNGQVIWQPLWQMSRPGMLLLNGKVYMAFGSHGDNGPYHGWVLGFDASTLQPAGVYNNAPNGSESGIWMAGAGLAADTQSGGRMFISNGNGDSTGQTPYTDDQSYGNAVERLDLGSGIHVADQWTPFDTDALSSQDLDQGSGGILVLPDQPGPHPHELVQVGKNGRVEVLDRDNLGGFDTAMNHVVQEIGGQVSGLWSTPAYWNGNVYFWGSGQSLEQFTLANGQLSTRPVKQSGLFSDYPGASPAISSNGTANGLVWALMTDRFASGGTAFLCAFDATDVSKILYASGQNPGRDSAGPAVKFTVPTVANGKVYVGTQTEVDVYGLLVAMPAQVPAVSFSPAPGTYATGRTVTLSDGQSGTSIFYTTDGTVPTPASTHYVGPITVADSGTIQAIATAPGIVDSNPATANYTIGNVPAIDFTNGFSAVAGMTLNGSAVNKDDTRLQLTTGGDWQAGSAFWNTPVNVQRFTTSFTFQLSGSLPMADGFTFVLQNSDPHALGPNAGGLGYGPDNVGGTPGLANSIAIKFDLYNNRGEGSDSTGLYVNGASPTIPAIDLTNSGIDLSSGHTFNASLTYDGTTLFFTLADPVAKTVFHTSYKIAIAQTIGSNTAYAGFTAGTGGYGASQKILTWTYTPNPDLSKLAAIAPPIITPAPGVYTGPQTVTMQVAQWDGAIFYTIDGSTPTFASTPYTGPISVSTSILLQAIAVAPGFRNSDAVGGAYIIASAAEPVLDAAATVAPQIPAAGVPVVADFDGDGKMDLAVLSAMDDTVRVLLGKGDGTFQAPVSYPVGRGPIGIAADDVNGDGYPDLVVVNKTDETVTVLLNNGDGTFPTHPSHHNSIGVGASGVVLADITGDGNLDAVVSYAGMGKRVSVLTGNGDGTFTPAAAVAVSSRAYGVATGDFDGDGYPDLLLLNSASNSVGVVLNDGTGKFLGGTAAEYAVGSDPSTAAVADLDGDGFPDVAVTNLIGNTISVLMNDGTGKLRPQVVYPTGISPSSVVAVDMNGDGIPDLVVTNLTDGTVGVLLGKGDGTFVPQVTWPLGAHPFVAVAGDFNGDGLMDVAITSFGSSPTPGLVAGPLAILLQAAGN